MIFKLFGSQPQPYSQFNEPLCPFDLLTTFYIQNLVLCSAHSSALYEHILLKFQILVYYSRTFTTKRSQHQKRKQDHWLSNESLNITESHVSMFRIITHTTHIHTQRYLYV